MLVKQFAKGILYFPFICCGYLFFRLFVYLCTPMPEIADFSFCSFFIFGSRRNKKLYRLGT